MNHWTESSSHFSGIMIFSMIRSIHLRCEFNVFTCFADLIVSARSRAVFSKRRSAWLLWISTLRRWNRKGMKSDFLSAVSILEFNAFSRKILYDKVFLVIQARSTTISRNSNLKMIVLPAHWARFHPATANNNVSAIYVMSPLLFLPNYPARSWTIGISETIRKYRVWTFRHRCRWCKWEHILR